MFASTTRQCASSRRQAGRLASAHNLLQEYIYEIICIKILAPIFTNALIFFYNAGLIFTATKLSKGRRRPAGERASHYCNSFLITHFLSKVGAYSARTLQYPIVTADSTTEGRDATKRTVAIGYRQTK